MGRIHRRGLGRLISTHTPKTLTNNKEMRNEMNVLRVVSQSKYGIMESDHTITETLPEEMATLAILRGVIKAGNIIHSFEKVETGS